jgi:glutaredoxin
MKKVTIFALSTCPWCRKAKQFFTDKNIPFECVEYDLAGKEEKDRVLKEMTRLGGGRSFPFVIIDDVAVEGFNPEKYEQCLQA